MMDQPTAEKFRAWTPPARARVAVLETSHGEQNAFTGFRDEMAGLTQAIEWVKTDRSSDLPGFLLKENIIYSALPLEREVAPFLDGLSVIMDAPAPPAGIRDLLDRMDLPCELTLYIALQCPHCPVMVQRLIPLAAYSDKIRLHIIDGSLFPEKAAQDRVMAAPCLILDNGFQWTGAVEETEILAMVLDRDPSHLSAGTLKNILEQGDADWITGQMTGARKIFKGFIDLLLHPTWSVRLGAMVVVEALGEQAPELALQLVPPLTAVFDAQEIPVQGDILYALGEAGDLDTKAWIRERLDRLGHGDLVEAARDAMDAIDSRQG